MGSTSSLYPSMNQPTHKYIGINQRVPFVVLDRGLLHYLQNGMVNRSAIRHDLQEFIKGENRLSKAVIYANQILTKPTTLLTAFRRQINAEVYVQLPDYERQAFCLSLLACTYPIAYDLIIAFAIGFKVQPRISRQYVAERIAAQYGSTRTIDIALDALLPMLIELNVIERAAISIYNARTSQPISNPFIAEAYMYADLKASKLKSLLANELITRPWYIFFHPLIISNQPHTLLKHLDGHIGGGYVSSK